MWERECDGCMVFDDNTGWVYLMTTAPNLAVNLNSLPIDCWSQHDEC